MAMRSYVGGDDPLPESTATHILIVDDDPVFIRMLSFELESRGYRVTAAHSLDDALQAFRLGNGRHDIVATDWILEHENAGRLLDEAAKAAVPPATIVFSGMLDAEVSATVAGHCDATLPKPFSVEQLERVLLASLKERALYRSIHSFADQFSLSLRERDVLTLAARGHNDRETAERLECKPQTVKTYWRRLFAKTGIRSRKGNIEAVLAASG